MLRAQFRQSATCPCTQALNHWTSPFVYFAIYSSNVVVGAAGYNPVHHISNFTSYKDSCLLQCLQESKIVTFMPICTDQMIENWRGDVFFPETMAVILSNFVCQLSACFGAM